MRPPGPCFGQRVCLLGGDDPDLLAVGVYVDSQVVGVGADLIQRVIAGEPDLGRGVVAGHLVGHLVHLAARVDVGGAVADEEVAAGHALHGLQGDPGAELAVAVHRDAAGDAVVPDVAHIGEAGGALRALEPQSADIGDLARAG